MLERIAHRGPDERDAALLDGLALGHNRLSIMEPAGGAQPRIGESGNALIYNGEIYGHRRFDAEIEAAGGRLRDHCDTETLFWLLELHGIDRTLELVDGMFAFAWYRARDDTLFLARDRFGQKPLFYAEAGGEIAFASEIKALRRHPGLADAGPDLGALRLYLALEYVPAPATGIAGIAELPAGHLLRWRRGELEVRPYWEPSAVQRAAKRTLDVEEAVRTLDTRLNEAVQQQLVADVPVGVFLSGGLDSSLVAAVARRHRDEVRTFTVRFPYPSFDESLHAESAAKHIGTRHTTVELDRQACTDGIERLFGLVDQPFADSSMLPSYLLCEVTRRHVTVALGGDGADELFLGYPNFRLLRAARLMAAMPVAAGGLLGGLARLLGDGDGYMNRAFLLRQLSYGIGRPAAVQSLYWMAAVPPAAQARLWRDDGDIADELDATLAMQVPPSDGLSLLERWQRQFLRGYLAGDILQKMDRASMYHSLEVRSPYLSRGVADHALALPLAALLKGSTGKRPLRALAGRYLPAAIIERRKHGFALPVSALLRSDLREMVQALLLDESNPMYDHLDFPAVAAWWAQHCDQERDHGKGLWALAMLAAFFRNQF